MISVELDVYSGVENERWDLTSAEAADFVAMLTQDLAVVRPVMSIPSVLGPKGYIVRLAGTHASLLGLLGVPAIFRITDLPLDLSYLAIPLGPVETGDSESLVASRSPTSSSIGGTQPIALASGTCSLAHTSWNDFTFWNGTRQASNNCYCYAANFATNNWSGPGRRGGAPLPTNLAYSARPTTTRFTQAMTADGWKTSCPGTSLRVVGVIGKVIAPNGYESWDYHFYRKNLNASGTARFCHKPGSTPATNKDYSGNYISTVGTADRSVSSGGYYLNYNTVAGTYYGPADIRSVAIH